jgi:hypothetical protein
MKRFSISLMALVFATMGSLPAFAGGNPNPGILPPNSHAFGTTYNELAGDWYNWLVQFPLSTSPVLEDGDVDCSRGQSGKVWFLAGNFGGTTERTCTIPPGKAIFFPLINILFWTPEDGATEDDIRDLANAAIDPTSVLEATIDGKPLQDLFDYRAESPPGGFALDFGPLLADLGYTGPDPRDPAVADGYWLLLAPLSAGGHTITFQSEIDGVFELDVTYHITVER